MTSPRPPRNFHLPLTPELHRRLHAAARRASRPATALARLALEEYLGRAEKAAVADGIRAYVENAAGTNADLNTDLESLAVDLLLAEEEE